VSLETMKSSHIRISSTDWKYVSDKIHCINKNK